ncbi:hypothetical protein [Motilibacter aurantiacus]|uniref:hypothetical protein n=1 Tax=Motilibacter aurantiacus TaxID=2714955 RepID=UPI00140CBA03|nr:hypothetical protein [Motilibacter aurantiacus]
MASQFPTGPQLQERVAVSGSDRSHEVVMPVRDVTSASADPRPRRARTLVFLFAGTPEDPTGAAYPVTHDRAAAAARDGFP